jgi:hypothetical protein
MAWFRVYFLNDRGKIDYAQEIEADNDAGAVYLAQRLLDAAQDIYTGVEVWQKDRQVARETGPGIQPAKEVAEITEKMQDSLLEFEEALRDSNVVLSRSHRLLERIEELRRLIGARPRPPEGGQDLSK